MSWQEYVDSSLVGTGDVVDKAAIFDSEGKAVWATSSGFTVNPKEMEIAAKAFKDNGEIFANGLYVAGQKYIVHKADEQGIYGKQGKAGIILVRTKLAILVAHYSESYLAGNASNTVQNLSDYLQKAGY